MLDRFTDGARRAFRAADGEVRQRHHDSIGPEHLLFGLLRDEGTVAIGVVRSLGIDPASMIGPIVANLRAGDSTTPPFLLPIGPLAKRALVAAVLEAGRIDAPDVHTHHLLIALAEDDGSVASMALAWAKLSPDRLRDAARSYLAAGGEAPHEGGEGIKPIPSRALRRPSVHAARLALTIDKINASIERAERAR